MSTSKVFTAGRFGARYGKKIRERVVKVEKLQKVRIECPDCGFKKVKRLAKGIFHCRKCELRFSGGAYYPVTLTGGIIKRMVLQRSFLANMNELISTRPELRTEEPMQEEETHKHASHKPKNENTESDAVEEMADV